MYQKYWVGLDVGHLETAVCLIDENGEILFEGVCETKADPIRDALVRFGVETIQLITVEAGVGTHMVRTLREYGFPVQVTDVRKSSKFLAIRRQKTDINDARGLAELGRLGSRINAGIFVKPLEFQNIRTQLNIRKNLLKQRTKLDTLIQSIIRLHGGDINLRRSRGKLALEVKSQIHNLQRDGFDVAADFEPLVVIAEKLREQIFDINKRLNSFAKEQPVCSNLQSIPGIGPVTALSFYSTIVDPFRFEDNRNVGAYLGLTPTLHQSGITSRRGGVSRFGHQMTRTNLTLSATVILCRVSVESSLRSWGLQLAERAGMAKARTAVARKLAVIMLCMWKSGSPLDPNHI